MNLVGIGVLVGCARAVSMIYQVLSQISFMRQLDFTLQRPDHFDKCSHVQYFINPTVLLTAINAGSRKVVSN